MGDRGLTDQACRICSDVRSEEGFEYTPCIHRLSLGGGELDTTHNLRRLEVDLQHLSEEIRDNNIKYRYLFRCLCRKYHVPKIYHVRIHEFRVLSVTKSIMSVRETVNENCLSRLIEYGTDDATLQGLLASVGMRS